MSTIVRDYLVYRGEVEINFGQDEFSPWVRVKEFGVNAVMYDNDLGIVMILPSTIHIDLYLRLFKPLDSFHENQQGQVIEFMVTQFRADSLELVLES